MPIGQNETHPFIARGEAINAHRMIVGTFPIYSITNPRTPTKNAFQLQNGDMSWFYGSNANRLWQWYQTYVDREIILGNPDSIEESLQAYQIAISDVIQQCQRIDYSSNDDDLKAKVWNTGLAPIIEKRIEKIICTSKSQNGAMGWLVDKILMPTGSVVHPEASTELQANILNSIANANMALANPIARVLTKRSKRVEIVSLPSPGSPYRALRHFGYDENSHDTDTYLKAYLNSVFVWFLKDRDGNSAR